MFQQNQDNNNRKPTMEEYRKAKELEEQQEYKPALMALLSSLKEPRRSNPKRESAIKDVAAILHKLGKTQEAIEFLHVHRFEMTNIPQFLNFTANLMFQFEPRPDDAYPRILVVKPISSFTEMATGEECERFMYEIFKFHRFKIEDVTMQEDKSTLVTFETHSSARKAACQWQKDTRSFIARVSWPNGDPIEVATTKGEATTHPTRSEATTPAENNLNSKNCFPKPETGTIGENKLSRATASPEKRDAGAAAANTSKRVIGSPTDTSTAGCFGASKHHASTAFTMNSKRTKKWVKIGARSPGTSTTTTPSRAIGAPRGMKHYSYATHVAGYGGSRKPQRQYVAKAYF